MIQLTAQPRPAKLTDALVLKKMQEYNSTKKSVWLMRYIVKTLLKMSHGKCAYCGCELPKLWHIDHIEPIVRDWLNGDCKNPHLKDNIENHNPSCAPCNIQKNSYSLEQFRENIKQFINSLLLPMNTKIPDTEISQAINAFQ